MMYLSQVQEWIVEFSCDMLFISIRTDVAWYRLSRWAPADGAARCRFQTWSSARLHKANVDMSSLSHQPARSCNSEREAYADIKTWQDPQQQCAAAVSDDAEVCLLG